MCAEVEGEGGEETENQNGDERLCENLHGNSLLSCPQIQINM